VLDLVPSASRLYPVGRLDKDSEGLLLLTSDGAFANRITHPRYEVEKEYRALVTQPPSVEMVEQLRVGLVLNGRRVVPDRVNVDRKAEGWWIDVTLHEGQKREVRRLLGAVGMQVHKLVRVRIGPVRLGRLRPGEYRPLESSEVEALLDGKRPKQSPTGKQPR
jgi:23S rRNA pseudouridine2605 synthase